MLEWSGDSRWRFPALNYSVMHRLPGSADDCVYSIFTDTSRFINYYRTNPATTDMAAYMAANNATLELAWIAEQLEVAGSLLFAFVREGYPCVCLYCIPSFAAATCLTVLVFGHHVTYLGTPTQDVQELIGAVVAREWVFPPL